MAFNNLKSKDFIDPDKIKYPVYIVGCGALGSAVAEGLARLGLKTIHLVDDDIVASHNLGNQTFTADQIGKRKIDALEEILKRINPEITVRKLNKKVTKKDRMWGYIFLCIDNIDTRRELCEGWKSQSTIILLIDGRMALTSGTVYAAKWNDKEAVSTLLDSMQYTHEEAAKETPVNACQMPLSVIYSPRAIACYMLANFVKYINTSHYYFTIIIDMDKMVVDSYM